jgi:hypothetical protein
MAVNVDKLKNMGPPKAMPFHISKLGHIAMSHPVPGQNTYLPK